MHAMIFLIRVYLITFLFYILIQYNKYNTIIEHVSTPGRTHTHTHSVITYIYKYTCTCYAYIIDKKIHPYRQRVGQSTSYLITWAKGVRVSGRHLHTFLLSCFTIGFTISVSVPPPCYRSST